MIARPALVPTSLTVGTGLGSTPALIETSIQSHIKTIAVSTTLEARVEVGLRARKNQQIRFTGHSRAEDKARTGSSSPPKRWGRVG